MEYIPFPATFTSDYNDIRLHGKGIVSGEENAIEFFGDFIPLIPLGSVATVEWITGQNVMAGFSGHVYLSSQNLVRIINVEKEAIAAMRAIFASNTRFKVQICPQNIVPSQNIVADMVYLSTDFICLLAQCNARENDELSLSAEVDFLTLHDLPLRIARRVPLRRGETLLLCDVLPTDNANFIALSAYSARLDRHNETSSE